MRLALGRRILELPAPAERLRVTVERFGPPDGDQRWQVHVSLGSKF